MVAALLYHAGLYLGPRKELMPPGPDNEDGYWENMRFVELNEELFRAAGGGWDAPPAEFDLDRPEVLAVRVKAAALGREFDQRSPWGWKDPRNTVTLPFWLDLFPQLRIVACVRNPLEVALSLHRRNDFSYERGLALWLEYNRRLLDQAPRDQLVLTHYDAYFADPPSELRRVLDRCGVEATALQLEKACSAVRPRLHHNRLTAADLISANASRDVIELYDRLCEASEWPTNDGATLTVNGSTSHEQLPLNRGVLDAALSRQPVKRSDAGADVRVPAQGRLQGRIAHQRTSRTADATASEPAMGETRSDTETARALLEREGEVEHLSSALETAERALKESALQVSEQDRRIGAAERTVEQLRADVRELHQNVTDQRSAVKKGRAAATRNAETNKELRAKVARLESQASRRSSSIAPQEEGLAASAEAMRRLQGSIDEALFRMRRTLDRVEEMGSATPEVAAERTRYARSHGRLGTAVADAIPFGATVLIASKGDENLLALAGRRGWHFPRTADGSYPWYYPGDSGSAIAQLEALRSQGADYIVFPASSVWWLTHYSDFRRHLERCYRLVINDKETGIGFSLREKPTDQHGLRAVVEGVVAELQDRTSSPAILDWTRTQELASQLKGQTVFSPLINTPPLPYVDQSAELVVVRQPDRAMLREARRIASAAVITINGAGVSDVEWIDRPQAQSPSASIVLVHRHGMAATERCLSGLLETIEPSLDVKFVVVDDASTDETTSLLGRFSSRDTRLQIIRNSRPAGLVASRNRGAKKAKSDLLIFLDSDALPTNGWLRPLLQMFAPGSDAGVVGGKIVMADGRLRAAGGIVFSDGSTANFGEWEQRVDSPLFSHTRDVDYCPGALLVTPRTLFLSLGGFDARFAVAAQAEADYCFKVRSSAHRVVYLPDSLVVHSGSDDPPADVSATGRTIFGQTWDRVLRTRPRRPARLDRQSWQALGVREPWE
jgi:GT2 family glycosyltransferase